MIWPNNKKFAFTIIDDTDQSTLYNVKPIYDFLSKIGMRTTKSVWSLNSPQYKISSINDFGETCEDDKYLDWLETPNENFGGRPVCPFLAPDRKSGKLKIEIYDPKVKTIWEHILIYDREDYNTALFLHIDDSIKKVTRAQWQTYLREGMRKIGLNHLKPICWCL